MVNKLPGYLKKHTKLENLRLHCLRQCHCTVSYEHNKVELREEIPTESRYFSNGFGLVRERENLWS